MEILENNSMQSDNVKISCNLEGESALDYEKLSMLLKIQSLAPNRPKQQAFLISAALLALDASMTRLCEATGQRYASLEEVLKYAGCRAPDIEKLTKSNADAPIDVLKDAIGNNNAVK